MTPIPVHDEAGKKIGLLNPVADVNEQRKSTPPMTPDQRAELQKRIDDRDNSLTLDELLDSVNLEGPSLDSKS